MSNHREESLKRVREKREGAEKEGGKRQEEEGQSSDGDGEPRVGVLGPDTDTGR